MANLTSLYQRLPIPLQQAACSLEGWRVQRRRYPAEFVVLLREYEERTGWPMDRLVRFRAERLQAFLRHCARTVPYYQRLFAEYGFVPRDADDLARLPLLRKADVQQAREQFVSTAVAPYERLMAHTSGTTGMGLRFSITRQAEQEQWAVWWRYRRWHGLPLHTLCGYFGGRLVVPVNQQRPPFWRDNLPGRQILFSAYHPSEANLAAYVAELRRRRPPWLHGYPSLLSLVASYLIDRGEGLGYHLPWLTTGAEMLRRHQAALLERAFGVKPRQHYGMAEAVTNISECERGRLHVDEDFAMTEFLPSEQLGVYRVVGTNFTNPATPLLRYEMQDHVTLSGEDCSCGRAGRVVAAVDGRDDDYVLRPDGTRLGRLDAPFKDMLCVREAQIVQREPGAVVVRVARGAGYTQHHETQLRRNFADRLGPAMRIEFEYVDAVQRSRTGKARLVISELAR